MESCEALQGDLHDEESCGIFSAPAPTSVTGPGDPTALSPVWYPPACLFLYSEREIILGVAACSSLKRSGAEAEEWLCLLTQPSADSGTREPNSCFDFVIAIYMALRKSPTVFASPLTFFALKASALRGRWSRKPFMSEWKAQYKAAVPTADSVGPIPALT